MTIEQERLTPTQEDREAAADAYASLCWAGDDVDDFEHAVRCGKEDGAPFVQAFAAHRLAALKSPPIAGVEVSPEAARSSARKVNEWVSRALDGTTSGDVGKLCEQTEVIRSTTVRLRNFIEGLIDDSQRYDQFEYQIKAMSNPLAEIRELRRTLDSRHRSRIAKRPKPTGPTKKRAKAKAGRKARLRMQQ